MNDLLVNPHLPGEAFYWKAGPTGIVMVHGFTATTAEVRLLAKRLHDQGFTIAAPLLPGHGTLPSDLNSLRWQDWYEEVEKAYAWAKQNCECVFASGESMGGLLALLLAALHPEIAGVMAYAPALRLAMPRARQFFMRLISPIVPSIAKSGDFGDVWQGYDVYPLRGAAELIRLQGDVRIMLPKIKQPLLVIQGRLDETVHPGVPDEILQRVKSTFKEVYWMDNSEHCVILDKELDQVTDLTLDFLRRATAVDERRRLAHG